ncbi:MAG: AIPR family protein [Gammaproteobacteria bacterium]|nr:AIPR family protein [Gammaproteobacteria bacterium]
MSTSIGHQRLYKTLCRVLDSLCEEAPPSIPIYHAAPGNKDSLVQARSRALLHLFLKARFGLVDFSQREKYITDGPQDGGVDAYYIDAKAKKIYVLQSKFRASAGNLISTNMSADDLLKMDVSRILKGEKRDEKGGFYNEQIIKGLQKAIQKLPDAGSYTQQVVLLGNTKNFTSAHLNKLVEGYAVDQFPHHRLYQELLFPVINGTYFTDPNLTIEINLANLKGDTHLDYDVKANSTKANIKLVFVPTKEIGRIMSIYRNSILKFNPRSFLELENNPVNKDIESSIKDEQSNEFALFNNGITIISDQTSISSDTAKQGTAQLVLRNPQLVNGGQTAYTLGRIFEECVAANSFAIFKGKEVILRVITFVGPKKPDMEKARIELIGDISRASNSQTKIEESDRRSNDEIQIRLQDHFYEIYGLYYERKRGEFADGIRSGYISKDQIVNREKVIRIALAAEYRVNQARSSVSKYFEETKLNLLLKVKDVPKYAYGYEVMRLLEARRKSKPKLKGDRYHTKEHGQALRYGQYAVAAVCINLGLGTKLEEPMLSAVLKDWIKFEAWAESRSSNIAYTSKGSFDFVNYYKGSTINADLQNFSFSV